MTLPTIRTLLADFPADSPLGPVKVWPAELQILMNTIEKAAVEIVVFWGPDYVALYNDTYASTIGNKHPAAFGRPARDYWRELWNDLEPLLSKVRDHGEVISEKDRPFTIERHGQPEAVTFNISYSPVFAAEGDVAGVLCIVEETTAARTAKRHQLESEERFRNMADSVPVMMWVVDATGYCTYLNTRWYDFTGQIPESAEGYGWLDATHPDDRQRSEDVFLAALKDRSPFKLEYRLLRKDGAYRWTIDAAEPRFDRYGTFLGYVGSVMDIDERHEMERNLRDSRRELAAITHSIDQMIWTTRPDGYHDFFNDRWYEFTGLTAGSTDGDGWNNVFHPDDQTAAWTRWRHSIKTGEPYEIEYRLRHRSGEYRWVIGRAKPSKDEKGQVVRWYGTCTDIHDFKLRELQRAALLELQEEIRSLDEPGGVAYAASRILGEFLKVDRVGYGLIDEERESVFIEGDWTSDAVGSIGGTHKFSDYGSFIDDLKQGRIVLFADAALDPRTIDNAPRLLDIGASAVVNIPIRENGRLVAVLFLHARNPRTWSQSDVDFICDVAERTRQAVERRRAERELRNLASSLEEQVVERTEALRQSDAQLRQSQKMEAIGQLTGGVAHDFNNNLAVIISGLNLIQRKLNRNQTDDVDMLIAGAMEGAQRAATLTHRLLAFARRQPLSPEVVDGNRMISGMDELLSRTLGEAIRVDTVLGAGLWKLSADLNQLENSLLNLAVNARDAMPEGGRMTIETANAHVDDASADFHGVPPGQYVLIAVSDTGTGMTEEVMSKAFDPFFTTKEVGKGTGLGLSQIFGFVRQSHGHVKICSELGIGTTIKMYLPRYHGDEEHQSFKALSEDMPESRGEAILLVEDDDRVRSFTENALLELGYAVTTAASGTKALALLRDGLRVDLLLTDIIMPEMTGRKLADAVSEFLPHLPVIYATGYTSNAVTHNGILDPGTNFLQKPYMLTQLAQKVRSVLDQAALRANIRG